MGLVFPELSKGGTRMRITRRDGAKKLCSGELYNDPYSVDIDGDMPRLGKVEVLDMYLSQSQSSTSCSLSFELEQLQLTFLSR